MARSAERDRFLKDVVVCFIEDGGLNAWRQIERYKYVYADEDDFLSPMTTCEATFIDVEDEGKTYEVNADVVAKGLGKLKRGEVEMNGAMLRNILDGDRENEAGNIDAYDADAIVQAAVFGELTYG
jgi:fructose-bisphosphate aldolase class 1